MNAASQVGDAVSPGELVSIYGTNYAFDALDVAAPLNGAIPPFLGHTRVLVGGLLAPITAASPTQINALIPYLVGGVSTADIAVEVDGMRSNVVTMPVVATKFGLSTLDASGSGPGAILNQDGMVNGASNPAAVVCPR